MLMKVVYNHDAGIFELSREALEMIGVNHQSDVKRDDYRLVEAVINLGKRAGGPYSSLTITEIPDNVDWIIFDVDGSEVVFTYRQRDPSKCCT